MTKNKIKADLQIAVNLAKLTKMYCDKLRDNLAPSTDNDISELISKIQSCESTDIDELMTELEEKYFEDAHITEDGPSLCIPEVSIDDIMNLEIKVPVRGGYLVAANGSSDFGTEQVCLMYEKDGYQIDLALAEVKSGELAETVGMPADNKDVELYVFADTHTEDYTQKNVIKYDDIAVVI